MLHVQSLLSMQYKLQTNDSGHISTSQCDLRSWTRVLLNEWQFYHLFTYFFHTNNSSPLWLIVFYGSRWHDSFSVSRHSMHILFLLVRTLVRSFLFISFTMLIFFFVGSYLSNHICRYTAVTFRFYLSGSPFNRTDTTSFFFFLSFWLIPFISSF